MEPVTPVTIDTLRDYSVTVNLTQEELYKVLPHMKLESMSTYYLETLTVKARCSSDEIVKLIQTDGVVLISAHFEEE